MTTRILIGLILALGLLAIWQRGSVASAQLTAAAAESARDAMQAERDTAQAALANTQAVLTTERRNAAAANALAAQYEQDKAHAQAAHDAVVADLRAGNQRLHQRWQAAVATGELSAAAATAGLADGATDDRIQSAGRAIGAAAACDAQVRGLQAFALLCSTPVNEVDHDRTAGDRPDVQRRSAVPAAQRQAGAR